MRKDDEVRIRHMLEAAYEALEMASGRSREDLDNDRMVLHALVRMIEVIGEAAAQVSRETRELHPNLPWRDMTSMRNRLIHAYFAVDADRVWETVEDDLPQLVMRLERISRDFDSGAS